MSGQSGERKKKRQMEKAKLNAKLAEKEPTMLHAVRLEDHTVEVQTIGRPDDLMTLSATVLVDLAAKIYHISTAEESPEQFVNELCEIIRRHMIGKIMDRTEE
jgi:hypothetical protein